MKKLLLIGSIAIFLVCSGCMGREDTGNANRYADQHIGAILLEHQNTYLPYYGRAISVAPANCFVDGMHYFEDGHISRASCKFQVTFERSVRRVTVDFKTDGENFTETGFWPEGLQP